MNTFELKLDIDIMNQINECLNLVKKIFGRDLLGIYLYGSLVVDGLHKYSDIDLFVVCNRSSTRDEKSKLATSLLEISGIYMKSDKPPIELTIVEKSAVNPWHYPPKFDFQYGEWLRKEFEAGNIEPWITKEMPDLAILITQILLASYTLIGPSPNQLLCNVPYNDCVNAMIAALPELILDLDSDTRNVLLTLARIWSTLSSNTISSKPNAADWAIKHLPREYHPALKRAKDIYNGDESENWDDIKELIKPCAEYILGKIDDITLSGNLNKGITIASSIKTL